MSGDQTTTIDGDSRFTATNIYLNWG
jgi:hypothetical protein